MNNRSRLNKVPGFRSNTTWKKVVAIIGYVCIALTLFIPINAETAGDYWVSFLERLIFIATPYMLILNVGSIRSKIPICRSTKAAISLTGAILFSAIWMIPAGAFTAAAETYLHSSFYIATIKAQNQQYALERQEKLQSESAASSSKLEQQKLSKEKKKQQKESEVAASKAASGASNSSQAVVLQSQSSSVSSVPDVSIQPVISPPSSQSPSSEAPDPAPAPAPAPTSQPAPAPVAPPVTSIQIVTEPGTVNAGQYATVKIKGSPNTQYTCTVTYKSGLSTAAGLGTTLSDRNGYASWTWKVGARTTAGSWPVDVSGAGESVSTDVVVR